MICVFSAFGRNGAELGEMRLRDGFGGIGRNWVELGGHEYQVLWSVFCVLWCLIRGSVFFAAVRMCAMCREMWLCVLRECHLSLSVLSSPVLSYANFSQLTPFGRRFQTRLRRGFWLLQEDGSYLQVEVLARATWEAWESCWRVYEAILLVLRVDNDDPDACVATPPSLLEAHFINFQSTVGQFPSADDRCRAELFPHLARQLSAKKGQSPPQWSQVFIAASEDERC